MNTTARIGSPVLPAALPSASSTPSAPSTVHPHRYRLRLGGLCSSVRLGHEAAEREQPQPVVIGVCIDFEEAPLGCRTDRLADTVCGDAVCALLRSVCESGEFALVEHLAARLYAAARSLVPESARVELELTKVAPPIPGLTGGMSFSISGRG